MGVDAERLKDGLAALAAIEPGVAAALDRHGWPAPRIRPRGHATLARIILGQQVSVVSAERSWERLAAALGPDLPPDAVLGASDELLRGAGLSRQKASYLRDLCARVAGDTLPLYALPADDEAAVAALSAVKGIGRWSAEIYLLFAEGRPDVWPAGDLAIQIETGLLLGLPERPSEADTRRLTEHWRPHRGAAAVLAWHHYTERLASRAGRQPV